MKEDGAGRVLVVDNGGSMRSSLLGDILARVASKHGAAHKGKTRGHMAAVSTVSCRRVPCRRDDACRGGDAAALPHAAGTPPARCGSYGCSTTAHAPQPPRAPSQAGLALW